MTSPIDTTQLKKQIDSDPSIAAAFAAFAASRNPAMVAQAPVYQPSFGGPWMGPGGYGMGYPVPMYAAAFQQAPAPEIGGASGDKGKTKSSGRGTSRGGGVSTRGGRGGGRGGSQRGGTKTVSYAEAADAKSEGTSTTGGENSVPGLKAYMNSFTGHHSALTVTKILRQTTPVMLGELNVSELLDATLRARGMSLEFLEGKLAVAEAAKKQAKADYLAGHADAHRVVRKKETDFRQWLTGYQIKNHKLHGIVSAMQWFSSSAWTEPLYEDFEKVKDLAAVDEKMVRFQEACYRFHREGYGNISQVLSLCAEAHHLKIKQEREKPVVAAPEGPAGAGGPGRLPMAAAPIAAPPTDALADTLRAIMASLENLHTRLEGLEAGQDGGADEEDE